MKLGKFNMNRQTAEKWILAVIPVILFLLLCMYEMIAFKTAAFIFMLVILALILLSFTKLRRYIHIRDRFGYVFMLAGAMFLMDGISTFYAASGTLTLETFVQVAAAFCLTVILVSLVPGERSEAGPRIARVLTLASAIAGVVSIDLIATQLLIKPILLLVGQAGAYMNGIEAGSRIISVIQNPNLFAGITGIGTLLSLGLASDKTQPKEKLTYNSVLFINSLSFVLAFSMGATASIGVAFIVLLIVCGNEKRGRMLVLMVETLICALGAAAVISATSFDDWDGINLIPIVVLVLGAAAHSALDIYVGDKISAKLDPKKTAVVLIAIALVVVVFVVLALCVTGELALAAGESVRRSAYPDAGEYTLEVESNAPNLTVTVISQNYQETMMHTETVLYTGLASGACFTVPEDSIVTYLTFASPDSDAALTSAVLVCGEKREAISLGYPLLPSFIVNRLQGLRANENAIQRTVFFSDGLKLAARSPIIGHGMGGFHSGFKSVQSFYYETRYVHNHYIETLIDTGIVGLCLFVGTLVLAFVTAFRALKKHPLVPALFAGVVYMAIHAGVEVVFSSYYYLQFALGTFAVIDLCCGDKVKAKLNIVHTAALVLFASVFAFFIGRHLIAQELIQENPTAGNVLQGIELDYYKRSYYMASYIKYSLVTEDKAVQKQAKIFAEQMRKDNSPDEYDALAEYYFANDNILYGFAVLERFVHHSASCSEDWNMAFELLDRYYDGSEPFLDGVRRIHDLLTERNRVSLDVISLTDRSVMFLEKAGIGEFEEVNP